jgi:hypothetical protein
VSGGVRGSSTSINRPNTARKNNASSASFEKAALDNPFAQGAFRWVALGKYTEGDRERQSCVTKWFKKGHSFSEKFFSEDILAVEKTIDLVCSCLRLKYSIKGQPIQLSRHHQ